MKGKESWAHTVVSSCGVPAPGWRSARVQGWPGPRNKTKPNKPHRATKSQKVIRTDERRRDSLHHTSAETAFLNIVQIKGLQRNDEYLK